MIGRLNLLERRLVESHATVVIPLDDRILIVSSLDCAEFSGRLSEVPQTPDPISGSQLLAGGRKLGLPDAGGARSNQPEDHLPEGGHGVGQVERRVGRGGPNNLDMRSLIDEGARDRDARF